MRGVGVKEKWDKMIDYEESEARGSGWSRIFLSDCNVSVCVCGR